MKKSIFMTMAAVVICGLAVTLFTQCTKDKVTNLEEQIIGKWMTADINGQPAPTNEKVVLTFVSNVKATMSASIDHQEGGRPWDVLVEEDVSISGNTVTLTGHPDESRTIVDENNMTTRPGVFAAGDVVHGSLTVVHAVNDAKNAAAAMMRYMEAGD